MKSIQKLVALLISAACLAMAVATVMTSRKNAAKQLELQQQAVAIQNEVRSLQGTEQVSRNVLTDLGNAALTNDAIKALLAKHGYTLTTNQTTAGASDASATAGAAQPTPVLAPMDMKAVERKSDQLAPKEVLSAPKTEVVTPPVSVPVEPVLKDVKKEEKP